MPYEIVDRRGTRSYPKGEASREHIVPRDGTPPYYRERLAANINGKTIRDVFLYEPDTKEVPLVSDIPTVKFGGLCALAWCTRKNLDRDHCYAKIVSTTHPPEDSFRYNP